MLPAGRATRHLKQRQIVNNGWTGGELFAGHDPPGS